MVDILETTFLLEVVIVEQTQTHSFSNTATAT